MFVWLFVFSFLWAQDVELTIAFEDKEQPPYYLGEGKDLADKPGLAVEMVKLLEERIPGLKIKFERYPWARCLYKLETGEVDGIFNASFKEERMKLGLYPWKDGKVDTSRRLTTISYNFYTYKESGFSWDGKNAKGVTTPIGAPRGYSIVGDIQKLGLKTEEANSSINNLQKLAAKRLVAIALQSVTGDAILNSNSQAYGNLLRVDPPLKTKPYYLMLSHSLKERDAELTEKIWDEIRNIREESFDSLATKYAE